MADGSLFGRVRGPLVVDLFAGGGGASHGIRSALGVSPIVAGRALKGPADRMLAAAGLDVSPAGVAAHLSGLMDLLLVDSADDTDDLRRALEPHVRASLAAPIVMHDDAARRALAEIVLAVS